ncbi:MAG: TOBE domain-containing protein [Acidimicrobiia bacterium]
MVSEGVLPATVSVVESLGHERHVICRLEDGQMVIVRQQSSEPAPGEGSMVRLAAEPGDLHIFDVDTERRIEPA